MNENNLERFNKFKRDLEHLSVFILALAAITMGVWYFAPGRWYLLPLSLLIVRAFQAFSLLKKFKKLSDSED
jgi:hypothetical protein